MILMFFKTFLNDEFKNNEKKCFNSIKFILLYFFTFCNIMILNNRRQIKIFFIIIKHLK